MLFRKSILHITHLKISYLKHFTLCMKFCLYLIFENRYCQRDLLCDPITSLCIPNKSFAV